VLPACDDPIMSGDAATWLGVIAIAIPLAAAAAAIPRALWRLDLRRRHEADAAQASSADRQAMLGRVRDKWIDGVLEPSLAHTERLPLDLVRNGRETTQVPILQLFLRTGGGLLITGAPGGGKTTLLLELADGLLERAESDPSQPVPVVVSLATWAPRRQPDDQPLARWLAGELAERYRLPAADAQAWAGQDDLVLLLDGLDEVPGRYRDGCAEAINRFLRDHPFTRVAVCCGSDTVSALSTKLELPQTVELKPAGTDQVDAYLARLETTWTPLADIRTALAADERLRVPLMLKVAALANRGRTPPSRRDDRGGRRLRAPEWPREIAEIFAPQPLQPAVGPGQRPVLDQATIWEAYVTRMLSQRSLEPGRDYDEATARRWLTWLAARLRDSGDPEFQLDYLAPDGQTQPHHRSAEWRRVLRHAAAWTDQRVQTAALDLARRLEERDSRGRTAGRLRDHAGRARPGSWLRRLPAAVTRPAEEVAWSPGRVPSPAPPLVGVLALPALTALVAGLAGWPLALIAALACGLLQGLNLPRRLGMVPRPRRPKTMPNESIRRSARQAALTGVATAAGFGIGLDLVCHVLTTTMPGIPLIALAAIFAGAAASVSNGGGACARHYLARFRLVRAGVIPWRYQTFLDAMTERTLLYRSGSGYLFIHTLLGEHLGHQQVNPAGNIANTPPALANTEVIPVALSHEPANRADQPPPQRVSHRAQQPAGRHSAGAG
jgi:hypothetical protein